MWMLEYSQEASNYALDSYPYNEAVLMAIESLAQTKDGIPPEGCTQLAPGRYWWEVARHQVLFRRTAERNVIRILMIKPLE